ncbi:hypothetical protein ZHAS_00009316 [Anopheles sinensis]|uniref:Chitin-binding type-2 domain-containing protein n=1 Tax=Anopheles sinensis TaxID=74873 RepID=A0A084VUP3_ANOSI|nr:hypothetical protein ZHAS_00009316 [Anopheles sinensis]
MPNGQKLPITDDCGSYIVCEYNVQRIQRCTAGTLFDPVAMVCNWAAFVKCGQTPSLPPILVAPTPSPVTIPTAPTPPRAPSVIPSIPTAPTAPPSQTVTTTTTRKPTQPPVVPTAPTAPPIVHTTVPTVATIRPTTTLQPIPTTPSYNAPINPYPFCTPDEFSFTAHPSACESYYICAYGKLILHSCGHGVYWNTATNQCDFPENTDCTNLPNPAAPENSTPSAETTTISIIPAVVVAILGCLLLASSSDAYNEICIGVPNLTYVRSPQACYLYYACIDGQAYGYTCPEDLWFSLELQRCVPQDESDCDIEQPPELPAAPPRPPSPECTDVDDFTYLPSDTSCQLYYQCIDNFAYLLSCPRGYWFSVSLGRCGNRFEVECDLEVPETTTSPPDTPGNLCFGRPNFSNVRDPQFCHRFYYCLNGAPFPMVCRNGFLFDETSQNCIPEEEAQCNEVPPTAPPTPGICNGVADGQMVLNPTYCNLYYVCVDETAFPSVCPDGEWFDAETQECGLPMDVFCPNGPQTTPTPNVCVDIEDGGYVASPERCEAFYVCSGGIGYIVYCSPGLWFDQVTRECTNPAEAICNVPTPPTPNTTPTIPPTIPPTGPPEEGNQMCNGVANNVNLPSPDDCSRFYICFNGGAYPSNCLGGLWFNPETSLCDLPENVDCDVVIPLPNACYLYYNCIDGNAYPQMCPEELWFSNEQQQCVTKEESDCTLTDPPQLPEAPEPEPSPLCDGVSNFRYVAAADSCQWYYQCIDGIAYLVSCPLYYWFDEDMQRCGTRYDVQCDREGSTTTIIPTPPTVDPLELCDDLPDFTLVPSASLCDRYYSCYQGNPYPQNCLPGLWFNPDTLECDDPENVECAAQTQRPPTTTVATSDCLGVTDDALRASALSCKLYYRCQNGVKMAILCPGSTMFDAASLQCVPPELALCEIKRNP